MTSGIDLDKLIDPIISNDKKFRTSEDLKLDQEGKRRAEWFRLIFEFCEYLSNIMTIDSNDGSKKKRLNSGNIGNQPSVCAYRRFLSYHAPLNFLFTGAKSSNYHECPPRAYVIEAILILGVIVFVLIGYFEYMFGKNVVQWQPKVRTGANQSQNCALAQDIIEDRHLKSRLNYIKSEQEYLGWFSVPYSDIAAFVLLTCSILIVVFKIAAYYVSLDDHILWMDSLTFILNPLKERERFYSRTDELIAELLKLDGKKLMRPLGLLPSNGATNGIRSRSWGRTSYLMPEIIDKSLLNYLNPPIGSRHSFARLVKEENIAELIHPANLSYEFHRRCLVLIYSSMIGSFCFGIITLGVIALRFIVGEILARTAQRIELAKCEMWDPSATLVRDPFLLKPLESGEERESLARYDQTLSHLIRLAIRFEVPRFFGVRASLTISLITTTFVILSAWLNVYIWSMVTIFTCEFEWNRQVIKQMDECIKLMETNQLHGPTDRSLRERKIQKALTVLYIHYELYRRHLDSFKNMINFGAFHIAATVVAVCSNAYLVITNLSPDRILFIENITYFQIAIFNGYFSLCSMYVNKLGKMIGNIGNIMAKICANSMEMSYIASLWRRQLLTDKEVKQLYATRVIGIQLTQSNLITLNSYLFVLWLLIFRPSIRN